MDGATKQFVELMTCDRDDPEGRRAATVLAAYFNVEQARAFRRLLCRQAAAGAVVACLVAATTSILPRRGLFIALLILGAAAAVASVAEWRATKTLRALL